MIAGVPVRDLQRLSPRVLAGVLPRLYPQMLERAYEHQDAGRAASTSCTAASQEMADLLAHMLAFDGGLGSRSEIVDGRYTGSAAGPFNYREGKVLSMRSWPSARASTWQPPTPTRTLSLTCRCCAPSGIRSSSTRTPSSRASPREEGWEVLRLDRLGQRLKVLAALGAVAALGGPRRAARRGARRQRAGDRAAHRLPR